MPHIFLGDEAFPLLNNLLKPYKREVATIDKDKAIFNYRLSRARRLVENSFGILAQRFRIFYTPIDLNVVTVEHLVTSACLIHNMMIDEKSISEQDLPVLGSNSAFNSFTTYGQDNIDGCTVRNQFKDYFNGAGAISWQGDSLECTNMNFFFTLKHSIKSFLYTII